MKESVSMSQIQDANLPNGTGGVANQGENMAKGKFGASEPHLNGAEVVRRK